MISKLLLTALVITIVFVVTRNRAQRPATPTRRPAEPTSRLQSPRALAYAIIVVMVLISAFLYYRHRQEENRLVTVRVTNIYTGESVSYQARKGDVGFRRFRTLDERSVSVADVERLEVLEGTGAEASGVPVSPEP